MRWLRSRYTRGLAWIIPLLAGPALLAAQQSVSLSRPDAEFPDPFSAVRGVRELADGRVLVSDFRDRVVLVLDLGRGTAAQVGREGQGPREYGLPVTLLAQPGGHTLLADYGNRRFLSIGPDGAPGHAVSPPDPPRTGGGGRGMVFAGALIDARGADARGRLYFQGIPLPFGDNPHVDSVPVLRWGVGESTLDTAAWVPLARSGRPQVSRQGAGAIVRIGGNRAWPADVQWGVAEDGRIAIVSPDPYRVTWISSRGLTAGPSLPVEKIRVTEAEKKAWRDQMARATPVVMTMGPGGSRVAPAARPPQEDPEWPETLPPFSGRNSVLVTPEGEVWVQRLGRASERTPRYDVFDGTGTRVRQVSLRPRSRIVGFGRGTVYVVRMDEDDLEYLERYRR